MREHRFAGRCAWCVHSNHIYSVTSSTRYAYLDCIKSFTEENQTFECLPFSSRMLPPLFISTMTRLQNKRIKIIVKHTKGKLMKRQRDVMMKGVHLLDFFVYVINNVFAKRSEFFLTSFQLFKPRFHLLSDFTQFRFAVLQKRKVRVRVEVEQWKFVCCMY